MTTFSPGDRVLAASTLSVGTFLVGPDGNGYSVVVIGVDGFSSYLVTRHQDLRALPFPEPGPRFEGYTDDNVPEPRTPTKWARFEFVGWFETREAAVEWTPS